MAKRKAKKAALRKSVKRKAAAKKKKTGGKRTSGLMKTAYSVSPELEEIIKTKRCCRPEIVKKLWVYIKAHKCQDTRNRRMINPDAKLSKVIGSRPVDMLKLAGCISKHIKS